MFGGTVLCQADNYERVDIWKGMAPGETVCGPNEEKSEGNATHITKPQLIIFRPEKQTSDTCMLIFPGGAFEFCNYAGESFPLAKYWNDKGYFVAVLAYRVPRPKGKPIYWSAFQDAQRAIRYLRFHAAEYGFDPVKIGVQGNSAGGCLALLVALNSETPSYEPTDEIDLCSAKLAFAISIYPAYVLDDGAESPNVNRGEGASILDAFHFDAQTPPLCLLHGDMDIYSSLGSVEVYKKLHEMNISCELHIYSGAVHGYFSWFNIENTKDWLERCHAWVNKIGF